MLQVKNRNEFNVIPLTDVFVQLETDNDMSKTQRHEVLARHDCDADLFTLGETSSEVFRFPKDVLELRKENATGINHGFPYR